MPAIAGFVLKLREACIKGIELHLQQENLPPELQAMWLDGALYFLSIFCVVAGLPKCSQEPRIKAMAKRVCDMMDDYHQKEAWRTQRLRATIKAKRRANQHAA